jgi:hypothetical protein
MSMLRRFLPVASDARLAAPELQRPIQLYDPQGILGRINRTFRRRLRDRVEDLFQDACISGDLATAEELLTVLEHMHARRRDGPDRRAAGMSFDKAREELARRRRTAERSPG